MNLFQCADAAPETVLDPVALQTPLGVVRLDAVLDGVNVAAEPPTETCRLPSGGWVACWNRPAFDLELLLCRPALSLPPHMHLTDCWAALWRLRAHDTVDSCTFTALWDEGYTWTRGDLSTGEGLYAMSWDDGQTGVSVGTEDDERLAARAQRGDGLPAEWAAFFPLVVNQGDWFFSQAIHDEVRDSGIAIPLPPLGMGQQCQVHFAVAWTPDAEDPWDWFAVDVTAGQILSGAGCS